jgi:AcrR family transcriptional regulator
MRQNDPEVTIEKLTQSALNILSHTSYQSAKLEHIAKDAGLTRGAIYWHFQNKLNLYQHILKRSFDDSMKDLFKILDSGKPCLARLEQVAEYLLSTDKLEIHTKSALIYNNLLLERPVGLENSIAEIESWFETLFEKHTEALRRCLADGSIRDDIDPGFWARAQYNFIWGYYTNKVRFFEKYDNESIIAYVKKTFIQSLVK